MLGEASRWPASTSSKPISLARAITVERAASSSAQVNTVGFSLLAGSRMTTIFFMLFLGLRLADTFNNESVIDCPLLTVLRDTLVCFAIVPIFRRLYVREFCYHDSL